jgi:hypothetical protein
MNRPSNRADGLRSTSIQLRSPLLPHFDPPCDRVFDPASIQLRSPLLPSPLYPRPDRSRPGPWRASGFHGPEQRQQIAGLKSARHLLAHFDSQNSCGAVEGVRAPNRNNAVTDRQQRRAGNRHHQVQLATSSPPVCSAGAPKGAWLRHLRVGAPMLDRRREAAGKIGRQNGRRNPLARGSTGSLERGARTRTRASSQPRNPDCAAHRQLGPVKRPPPGVGIPDKAARRQNATSQKTFAAVAESLTNRPGVE